MSLYLNTRWSLDDIKKVIERLHGKPIIVKSNDDISVGYFVFMVDDKFIHVFVNSQTPIGSATLLKSEDNKCPLLKQVARVLGGFLENVNGNYEKIGGKMDDANGIPYFVKNAILKDDIGVYDFRGFIKSVNDWYLRVEHKTLNVLKDKI
jgi:hypothetical protein